MKIIKLLLVLLLACMVNAAVIGSETAPANSQKIEKAEPGFWDRLFGSDEDDEVDLNAQVMPQLPEKEEPSPAWIAVKVATHQVLLYFANVAGDLFDIVSWDVSVGNTFAADVHATYFVDLGLEKSDAYFYGYGPFHRNGGGRREAARAAFLCWSYDKMYISQIEGKQPTFNLTDPEFNLVRYKTAAFDDDDIDCWSIGFRLAMFLGISVDLHLIEIPDFFCQLVNYDLWKDNWQVLYQVDSGK